MSCSWPLLATRNERPKCSAYSIDEQVCYRPKQRFKIQHQHTAAVFRPEHRHDDRVNLYSRSGLLVFAVPSQLSHTSMGRCRSAKHCIKKLYSGGHHRQKNHRTRALVRVQNRGRVHIIVRRGTMIGHRQADVIGS